MFRNQFFFSVFLFFFFLVSTRPLAPVSQPCIWRLAILAILAISLLTLVSKVVGEFLHRLKMAAGGSVPTEAGFAVEVKTDCLHVLVFFFFFLF